MATAPKLAGYETTFITRAEMNEDQLKSLQDKIKEVIASFKGEVVAFEDWGTKKLAYKIEKESRGRFSHFVYTASGNVVSELERNLRMNDYVMRFLSVNVAKEFNQDEYMKRKDAIKAQAKKREEEREARREERNAERKRYENDDSSEAAAPVAAASEEAEGSAE